MPNKIRSLKFETVIERGDNDLLCVSIFAQAFAEDGNSESRGTHSFLLPRNGELAQRALQENVGGDIVGLFVELMAKSFCKE